MKVEVVNGPSDFEPTTMTGHINLCVPSISMVLSTHIKTYRSLEMSRYVNIITNFIFAPRFPGVKTPRISQTTSASRGSTLPGRLWMLALPASVL